MVALAFFTAFFAFLAFFTGAFSVGAFVSAVLTAAGAVDAGTAPFLEVVAVCANVNVVPINKNAHSAK
ncbi:MAG: hypothetical protein JNJ85_09255 [Candidatus Kapabacteria bacterium]|nr:hypothetical protein [Candidatus Kapabacteria bacterium]